MKNKLIQKIEDISIISGIAIIVIISAYWIIQLINENPLIM